MDTGGHYLKLNGTVKAAASEALLLRRRAMWASGLAGGIASQTRPEAPDSMENVSRDLPQSDGLWAYVRPEQATSVDLLRYRC